MSGRKAQTAPAWRWSKHFPRLAEIEDPAWLEVCAAAYELEVPAGTVLFREGDQANQYLMLTGGAVRVSRTSRSGREVMLYRVNPGDTCVLMTAVLLSGIPFPATATVEVPTRAVTIPAKLFRKALHESHGFREFLLTEYSATLCQLIGLIDDVVFGRVDARLARVLAERAPRGGTLSVSHKDLARELGTAREVISRQLKVFEAEGCIAVGRGRIEVKDPAALAAIAETDD